MKYKAEIVKNGKVVREFYYSNRSHPNQVARAVVQFFKGKLDFFIIFVVNDMGEVWRYSVMSGKDAKLYIRQMDKGRDIYSRNDLDMIFTGNKSISGGFK